MPSTLGKSGNKDSAHIGYERRNDAVSRSGLVTIGGGSTHQNNGHWSRLEGFGRHGVDGREFSALNDDIEMQPRGKLTGVDASKQDQPGYCQTTTITKGSMSKPQVTVTGSKGNDSDESLLAAHGITCRQTVEVEWTTTHISEPDPMVRKGARP